MSNRVLVWFSCGAASAVAAMLAVVKYPRTAEILYCNTLAYEHPDNKRFMRDIEIWTERPVKILSSPEYKDIYDVFEKTRYLVGIHGARCTQELKRNVRKSYQLPGDIHIFGFTADEEDRIDTFDSNEPDIQAEFILHASGITKSMCYQIIKDAGIELPMMYRLGYRNNNCIGCVKGQKGYWNKIRRDFPDYFWKMAVMERKLDVAINKTYIKGERVRVFLDELDPLAGREEAEADIECGVLCVRPGLED